MELTVAITGASGAVYAHRTLTHLASSGVVERINLIVSDSARTVAMVELGFDLRSADEKKINEWIGLPDDAKIVRLHRLDNMAATPSSGSHPQAGMIIDGDARRDRFGSRNEFDSSRRGCNFERRAQAGFGATRDALQRDSFREYVEAVARRRTNCRGQSGLVSSATNNRSARRSSLFSDSRSVWDSTLNRDALEGR